MVARWCLDKSRGHRWAAGPRAGRLRWKAARRHRRWRGAARGLEAWRHRRHRLHARRPWGHLARRHRWRTHDARRVPQVGCTTCSSVCVCLCVYACWMCDCAGMLVGGVPCGRGVTGSGKRRRSAGVEWRGVMRVDTKTRQCRWMGEGGGGNTVEQFSPCGEPTCASRQRCFAGQKAGEVGEGQADRAQALVQALPPHECPLLFYGLFSALGEEVE